LVVRVEMKTMLRTVGLLVCAAALYVIGIGPVLRVTQGNYRVRWAAEEAYGPLLGSGSGVLDWYLDFWGVRFTIHDVTPLPSKK
jgi:hypothetical protein